MRSDRIRVPRVVLAALPLVACSGKSEDSGPVESVEPHAFGGAWNGTIAGHAELDASWQEVPYCTGNLYATVALDGAFDGNGACTIDWGPAEGETFSAAVHGTIDEAGNYELSVTFEYEDDSRSWERATLRGTVENDTIVAEGATQYNSDGAGNPAGIAAIHLSR
jgi:hypothetical protein